MNNHIFNYAIKRLLTSSHKNIAIMVIFAILVALFSSVIFITNSLKFEYNEISKEFPDILVQKSYGGKIKDISEEDFEPFYSIPAITSVQPRVWGQYYFEKKKNYFSIFGILEFNDYYNKNLTQISQNLGKLSKDGTYMLASKNVYDFFDDDFKLYKSLPVFTPNGKMISLKKAGILNGANSLENNDLIVVNEKIAREILGVKDGFYSDVLLRISNPKEVDFIADKIRISNPKLKLTTKKEMIKKYDFLFNYKSGWFLMVFLISLLTFCIILYDKASGISSEEKREIGILKALGWEISHIIIYKLSQALILSCVAFIIGVIMAIFYVYFLDAPILKYVFCGYSSLKHGFHLIFTFDLKTLALLFFATIPIYVAVCIIPSWKAASNDVGELIK